MSLKKITSTDLSGKGVVGMADTPNLTALELQQKVEEIVRGVVIPTLNENIDSTVSKELLAQTVFEAGAGDMTTLKYDANKDGIVTASDNGVFMYTHTKAGTVHSLSGSGENIKFVPTSDFIKGDSFNVNGAVVTVKNLFCFNVGDTVGCILRGAVLDFGQYVPESLSMKLIWQNASPSNSFPGQTVANNNAGFDAYMVEFRSHSRTDIRQNQMVSRGYTNVLNGVIAGETFFTKRWILFTDTTFKVDGGYSGPDLNNNMSVPLRIYGIKGVQDV